MTEEKHEALHHCEECSKPVYSGDMAYFDGEGVVLCEDHAPMLSDAVAYCEEDLAKGDDGDWPQLFDSPEDAAENLAALKEDLATNGDRKLLHAA